MRCAKMAEPIEMQFEMLCWVGKDAPTRQGTIGGVWPIETHCKA